MKDKHGKTICKCKVQLNSQQAIVQQVTDALTACHDAFKRREHGGAAEQKLRHDLERILNKPYDD
ncbi:MAG: hypothetical protein AB2826_23135 [Candidatus Thiodiazotropha sp.]